MDGIKENISTRAADTVLQKPFEVKAGTMTFTVPPPTVATVIAVSGLISRIPEAVFSEDDSVLAAVLSHASECGALGQIAAMLILGEKEYSTPAEPESPGFLARLFRREHPFMRCTVTKGERLARRLERELTPGDFNRLITEILLKTDVADFFALTTFLTGVNCLRRTKVGTEATRSGQ